jgi:hypothetical protein
MRGSSGLSDCGHRVRVIVGALVRVMVALVFSVSMSIHAAHSDQPGAPARLIPAPLSDHPGNIFLRGTEVSIPVGPERTGGWVVLDIDGHRVASGTAVSAALDLGPLPTGYYRVLVDGAPVASAAVIEPLLAPVPSDSPVCLQTWFAGHYILKRIESIDTVANLAALAGTNGIRDATAWPWQLDAAGDWTETGARNAESFPLLLAATRRAGLDLLTVIEPGTPEAYTVPGDWGLRTRTKFPADLRDYARFVRHVVTRSGDGVSSWEAWNEPEGIGGLHLGSEITSTMKVFALAAHSVRPETRVAMGMGGVPAESMQRNAYLEAIDTYDYHAHRSPEAIRGRRRALDPYTGQRPVWLTEVSYGSYPLTPDGADLTPEAERQQAEDIPKIFARAIHDGNERVYYFTLLQVSETAGRQWGLLRAHTLQPRPGYLALAAAGRLLAGARPAGALAHLPPGLEGWSFSARPDGKEKGVLVLWSKSDASIVWQPPADAVLFDLWGRPIEAGPDFAIGPEPVWCVVPSDVAHGLSRDPVLVRPVFTRPVPGALCPVVADYRRPERLKNQAGDFFLLTQGEPELDVDVYNFSATRLVGTWTVESPAGFTAAVTAQPGPLDPDDRRVLRVRLTPSEAWTAEAGRAVRWLRMVGDYGAHGRSVLAIPFVHCPADAKPSELQAILGLSASGQWRPRVASGTTLEIGEDRPWTRFKIAFGTAPNATIGLTWAAPFYQLAATETPRPDVWGVTLTLRKNAAPNGASFALNLIKRNGAVWTCPLPYEMKQIESADGVHLLLPFSWFAHLAHRAPDPDGALRAEDIVGLEFAVTSTPSMLIDVDLADVAWVAGPLR